MKGPNCSLTSLKLVFSNSSLSGVRETAHTIPDTSIFALNSPEMKIFDLIAGLSLHRRSSLSGIWDVVVEIRFYSFPYLSFLYNKFWIDMCQHLTRIEQWMHFLIY